MALAANALTDYATVAADLGLSGATDQALIERIINAASAALENYCNRQLAFLAGIIEPVPMRGNPRLLVTRTPVLALGQIVVDQGVVQGNVLDGTEYYIDDAFMGSVWRDAGWPWSALLRAGRTDLNFTQDQQPQTEKTRATVAYGGGYVTSPQAYGALPWVSGTYGVGALCKPAGQPSQLWIAGPIDPTKAMTTGAVEPTWLATPTQNTLQKQAPTAEAGSAFFPTAFVNGATLDDGNVRWFYLGTVGSAGAPGTAVMSSGAGVPPDLEEACILAAKAMYRERKSNPNIKSESLLGASVSFDRTTGLPMQAMALADQHRRFV